MTIEELKQKMPWIDVTEWHQHPNGGGWVHNTAEVPEGVYIAVSVTVGNDASIGNRASIGDDASIDWSLLYIQGSRHSMNMSGDKLRIGCQVMTFDEWREEGPWIARKNDYTDAEQAEYTAYIDLFEAKYKAGCRTVRPELHQKKAAEA